MATQRHGEATWQNVFDIQELQAHSQETAGNGSKRPLFVDIGGGIGHQCRALRQWLPAEDDRRIILQDMPAAIAAAGSIPGVEVMAHDMWQAQPVKGKIR